MHFKIIVALCNIFVHLMVSEYRVFQEKDERMFQNFKRMVLQIVLMNVSNPQIKNIFRNKQPLS